ncbi:MAG: CRISPR-associated ring nuclease Csm6 [Syntrophales bacterium]|jgi:CRISPR-associated protein Csx14|nr:CRISPR-associated ring nuclease Csm6 [Syntrophales bacterium]
MKSILLAVSGMTPQVITETLYALHQEQRRIDAIHVITTRRGKEMINAHLLSTVDGQYQRYLDDYGINPRTIAFDFDHIHTVTDINGIEIDDIEDEEENERLLETCLDLTFRFTQDPNTAVFFSIAGGRKTMSACLMVAAQLYGRTQDRVYHVLVSPEYESNREFYYPPPESRPIELQDDQKRPYVKETKYAAVTLVPIPFVSIRDKLSQGMLKEPKDPATLMLSLIKEESFILTVDLSSSKIVYKKIEMDMMPTRLALYAFFALQKKQCKKERRTCKGCNDCYLSTSEIEARNKEIADLYKKIAAFRDFEAMKKGGITDIDITNFNSYKSRIKENLQKGFGRAALNDLEIESAGKRPDTKYGLKIDRDKIRVIF